ncbi:hypothetical protein HAZT_HAZT007958 [Hyalella azteca]|uniref:Ig-like domain-containing protein n=1 Tax=Hyalella azteca TaxID=294128 RepID=A0A6A0GP93_HYAAZ|nr:hypothetical protein HAZT_HAZT007958 [Hyalella azteca]
MSIDAKTAFEPVGLKGRRISTATSIESFAPSPRLPFEQLSPFTSLPSTDDYHSPITVTEGTSLEGKISPKHRRFSKGAPRRSSAVATAFFYGSNLTTAAATAASARWCGGGVLCLGVVVVLCLGVVFVMIYCLVVDSSLCHSSSSPSVTQHRWSAGECPPTSCSLNPSPGSPQIPPNSPTSPVNYSTPPSSQVPSGSPSPPKHKRSLLDGFKTGLRPKSRLEADVHSCESHGGAVSVGVGTLVQILQPYAALREDEITVARGEEVQVMSSSARGYLIHRPATSQSPAAEAKKSWMKFRKPSFSKREAKAAAALRKDEVERVKLGLAMQSSGDYGNNSMERYASFDDTSTLSDRNSIGSGSFGGADLYSVSNSSDISISDRLSCGANSSMDYLNTLNRNVISTLDDVSECVIVGDGGDDLLHVVRPLTSMTLTTTGQPVTLTLHIGGSGVQAASVSWFGPSGELENDTRFEQQHLRDGTVSLHLDTCTSADLGRYTCVVTCVDNVASRQLRCSATVSLSS